MSRGWTYKPGDWNIICDVCGFKKKASEIRHRWDGAIVCKEDWEPRHPMDFLKVRADKIQVPFVRLPHPILDVSAAVAKSGAINQSAINAYSINSKIP